MLLLLSVQVGGGGDETSVRVDAEEFIAGTREQAVPHHSVLLCKEVESRQYANQKKSSTC